MGRELQKRKNRSSISKVRQKPKSKKKILTNPIIAANWDKTQTLEQNYKRLGLTNRLNKVTGGVERKVSDVLQKEKDGEDLSHTNGLYIANSTKRAHQLELSEARIERDADTGKIVRVLDEATVAKPNPLQDPLNDIDSESEIEQADILNLGNQHGNTNPTKRGFSGVTVGQTETVRRLEEEASRPAHKHVRRQPDGEREFVEDLVREYGDDYSSMARDMKINYMQRSEGDIKRRTKKWRESGGTVDRNDRLCET